MDLDKKYVMQTYGRQPLALEKGSGAVVWDVEGKSYIDCVAGIAVNNVGHELTQKRVLNPINLLFIKSTLKLILMPNSKFNINIF